MKKIRVLAVDDNKNLIEMMKEYFKDSSDIEISLEAHDGSEGLRLIEKKQDEFDVVLLDLIMPNKDGVTILEHMKNKNIDKKVIVLTSYNTQDMIRKVSELGISYFVLKPFELEDLEKRILKYGADFYLFEETILKVTDKDSIKYKICYDSYIERESDVSLSFKYNYSIAGIRKIKDRINAKIKELK